MSKVETVFLVKNCCGMILSVNTERVSIQKHYCETCGDRSYRQYKCHLVRADVDKPVSAYGANLLGLGVDFSTIREIDAIGAEGVYLVPHVFGFRLDACQGDIWGREVA